MSDPNPLLRPEDAPAVTTVRRLAVLGSPIAHSLSPALQSAAYRLLDLPFDYGRAEVVGGALSDFLATLDESWLGLSLTMPLKREVVPLLSTASPLVRQLGVANTVVIRWTADGIELDGYNTDVDGIVRAMAPWASDASGTWAGRAAILGGGATAASALAAFAELGVSSATLFLRDPSKAAELLPLADELGVEVTVAELSSVGESGSWSFIISTLPGGADVGRLVPDSATSLLLDVAYDPWPSPLATGWESLGGATVSGLDMLVEQAIGQIRLFTGRAQDEELDDEGLIRASMRQEVGLGATPGTR